MITFARIWYNYWATQIEMLLTLTPFLLGENPDGFVWKEDADEHRQD